MTIARKIKTLKQRNDRLVKKKADIKHQFGKELGNAKSRLLMLEKRESINTDLKEHHRATIENLQSSFQQEANKIDSTIKSNEVEIQELKMEKMKQQQQQKPAYGDSTPAPVTTPARFSTPISEVINPTGVSGRVFASIIDQGLGAKEALALTALWDADNYDEKGEKLFRRRKEERQKAHEERQKAYEEYQKASQNFEEKGEKEYQEFRAEQKENFQGRQALLLSPVVVEGIGKLEERCMQERETMYTPLRTAIPGTPQGDISAKANLFGRTPTAPEASTPLSDKKLPAENLQHNTLPTGDVRASLVRLQNVIEDPQSDRNVIIPAVKLAIQSMISTKKECTFLQTLQDISSETLEWCKSFIQSDEGKEVGNSMFQLKEGFMVKLGTEPHASQDSIAEAFVAKLGEINIDGLSKQEQVCCYFYRMVMIQITNEFIAI